MSIVNAYGMHITLIVSNIQVLHMIVELVSLKQIAFVLFFHWPLFALFYINKNWNKSFLNALLDDFSVFFVLFYVLSNLHSIINNNKLFMIISHVYNLFLQEVDDENSNKIDCDCNEEESLLADKLWGVDSLHSRIFQEWIPTSFGLVIIRRAWLYEGSWRKRMNTQVLFAHK